MLLKVCLFCVFASYITSDIPVVIKRRLNGDIIYYDLNVTSTNFITCGDDNNLTFLVSERRCVKNQELLNGIIKITIVIHAHNEWLSIGL